MAGIALARRLHLAPRRKAGDARSAMQQLLNFCRGRGRRVCMAIGFLLAAVLLAAAIKGEAIAIVALGRRFAAGPHFPTTIHLAHRFPSAAVSTGETAPGTIRPEFTLAPPKQQSE
jgi:hypothetical protein